MIAKNLISIIVLIILAISLIYFVSNNYHSFKELEIANPINILYISIFFLTNYILISEITLNLLKPFLITLKRLEAFQLSIVTGFYNLITPLRGGAVARAIYLKTKHNFPYTDFLGSLSASYVIIFLISSLLGLASTILIFLTKGTFSLILFTIFLVIFLGVGSIIIFSPRFRETENSLLNKFIRVANSWHIIKHNNRVIFMVAILSLTQLIISTFMLQLQFNVFRNTIPFIEALFLTSIGNLSLLIQLTPANLGIQEAIIVFSANTLGISPIESLSAAILGRLVSFIILFILGPIFSYKLLRKSPKEVLTK